ncbi:MAG: ribonuclease H-like domain-containing protein [Victivallales bacterium]|jgi:DNA polymerase elongation subunit (family B)|nr:ribonuclease H-like domain-containing protein [Victivallales bacterium]
MFLGKLVESQRDKVVAVETRNDCAVFFYHDNAKYREEEVPFTPMLLLSSPEQLSEFSGTATVTPLTGNMVFRFMAKFPNQKEYESALKFLRQNSRPFYLFRDLSRQILQQEETRLFSGMEFRELRRMQFDLEVRTTPGFEFPNPDREADEIVIISICDSTGYEQVLSQKTMSEKELIEAFVQTVAERDPDVIEGHNLCRFDLPYLETRAKRHKVKLALGRGGATVKSRSSRFNLAERIINYTRYDIFGRHVVDTLHLAMMYDVSNRNLESYNLKYLAKHFNFASEERTYIDGEKISEAWEHDREKLLAYALDDVRETRSLGALLSPSYFFQTSILPMSYQDVIIRGSGTSLDALFIAEYLKAGHSLPMPELPRPFAGALSRADKIGIFENVWHCDVRSLYPSILLASNWAPSRDVLKVFPRLLDALRTFRLEAKDAMRATYDLAEQKELAALQGTFKILINSFYGYLGFSQGAFNDYALAEQVTARGREILTLMLDFLTDSGANVLEMDTDGIYFQPPPTVADQAGFQQRIQAALPPGIEVELDATYAAMFSYKSKNYALLGYDNTVGITGAALKSRGLEPFQRSFISQLIELLLKRDFAKIPDLYYQMRDSIEQRKLPLSELAKSENLNDSLESYKRKLAAGTGRRSAAYELAIRSNRAYQSGDQVTYYLTGVKKKVSVVDNAKLLSDAPTEERDENIAYYLNKLDELYANFKEFLPEESNPLGI